MNDKHLVGSQGVKNDLDSGGSFVETALSTKSQVPLPRPNRIQRPRLVDRLAEGLAQHRPLTLVSAPAGFGKTTLVSDWILAGERPTAWLSLDEPENDPARFVTYLIAALQRVNTQLGRTALSLSGSAPNSLIPLIMNDISAFDQPLCLILDDYQVITSASVHQLLRTMLQHQPQSFHLVIITREDPPLPLARMRAQSQITEIRERDLRFRLDEIASFLHQTMGLELSTQAIEALETRTEGWIAGLQLVALALHENAVDADEFIRAFTGSDRYIMDYLVGEVIDRQPETIRSFLRQTAILDRLSADLCDTVTGRTDSLSILDRLDKANLFIIPLDHRRGWYRYHRLFAEVLRATLPRAEQAALRIRASHWYEQNSLLPEAIEHLRAYASLSGDIEEYIRLVTQVAEELISQGSGHTLQQWLNAVPEDRIRQDPLLAGIKGWTFILSGEMDLANEFAGIAGARAADTNLNSPMILALDAFLAVLYHQDYERAISLVSRTLQGSEGPPSHWELILLWALAESQERTRPISEAIATLRKASRMQPLSGDAHDRPDAGDGASVLRLSFGSRGPLSRTVGAVPVDRWALLACRWRAS
jgi:LuxR family maltose regulon positive regulatory protein